jgi:hypothetical protein
MRLTKEQKHSVISLGISIWTLIIKGFVLAQLNELLYYTSDPSISYITTLELIWAAIFIVAGIYAIKFAQKGMAYMHPFAFLWRGFALLVTVFSVFPLYTFVYYLF